MALLSRLKFATKNKVSVGNSSSNFAPLPFFTRARLTEHPDIFHQAFLFCPNVDVLVCGTIDKYIYVLRCLLNEIDM